MKKKAIKLEGVSLNPVAVAGMDREAWLKFGKEAGYFTTIGNNTSTPQQQTEMLSKAYELAQEKAGIPPAKVATPKEEKPGK